jgi:glycosyltransferase involved in cell wall biosynthesis
MRVIHNGVVFGDSLQTTSEREALRQRYGAQTDDVLVGFIGRLSSEKGVDLILQALTRLPSNYKLVVAGDGPDQSELESMAARLGLADRVAFLGFVTDPQSVMTAADFVAVPSTWHEACSRVVVESLAHATPVVGSNIGGTPELVSDDVEGLLVEAGSVDALVAAFRRIGEDPALRKRLAAAARARAERDFRMESVVGKYAAIYAEANPP